MIMHNLPLVKSCANLLPVIRMPQYIFQEDLSHDLTGHGGEVYWLVVLRVVLLTFFLKGHNVSLVLVIGDVVWLLHNFTNTMENGLATTSANSLRTLTFILCDPVDLCMLRFLKWSQIWFSPMMGGTASPLSWIQTLRFRLWEEQLLVSGWLKSPRRIRACEHDSSCSWS